MLTHRWSPHFGPPNGGGGAGAGAGFGANGDGASQRTPYGTPFRATPHALRSYAWDLYFPQDGI